MKNTLVSILMVAAISIGLVACTPDAPSAVDQPTTQASSHSGTDMVMGGFMGYMLGRMSGGSQNTTHVVERTVVKEVPAKTIVSEQPKLHSGQTVIKPTTPSSTNIYSRPSVNTYSAPSRNIYSSPSRSFSSGRR